MELRDFAEQIPGAAPRAEKPQGPPLVPGDRPGPPMPRPTAPGSLPGRDRERGGLADVYVFNPFTEGHIAQGRAFSPTKPQQMLSLDLANLPQYLCRQGDLVLLPERLSGEFLESIEAAGFFLPEFVDLEGGRIDPAGSLSGRKLGRARPWAWGPDSVALFEPLWPLLAGETRSARQCFNAGIAGFYSKAWSAAFLRRVLSRWPREGWLCTEAETGVAADTLPAALEAMAAIRRRGHHRVVVKQALGLAGQNALRLWEPELLETHRRWLAHALERGQRLVIEPWLERALDFSVQMEMGPQGLELCGYTGLINDHRGQFQANWAAAGREQHPPAAMAALLGGRPDRLGRIRQLYADIAASLEDELRRVGYLGPVGLDAFVYRAPSGECRVKPIVEINPRYTMGRLTLELTKQSCPGSYGVFRLVSLAQARAEGFADLAAFGRGIQARFPLRFAGTPGSPLNEPAPGRPRLLPSRFVPMSAAASAARQEPRPTDEGVLRQAARPGISEGALCLNDPAGARLYLAVFHVSRNLGPDVRV